MRELEWEDMGVKVDGRQLHHLRFADDIGLMTPSISHVGTLDCSPANSPSSPCIDPVRLTDALKEVNKSPALPACVKNAFNSLVDELTSLKRERDKLLEENQILLRRLGLRPDSSVHDTVADVPDDGQVRDQSNYCRSTD
ncbi:unnamed protein product [Heligmosomoides polygyrus]|uniref:Reverse transcriptase domain-containing protein n=1 Tax=Heligmosomoides polygyrus TaxID=6339 RepID=A0A183GRX4_HELPZ|nr:unnamed protein product [Heligmosomoides polygyrus]